MPSTHHRHSPSTLKYKSICPGFESDQTGDMTAADEGTVMHLAYETGDLSGLSPEHAELMRGPLLRIAELEAGADEVHKELRLSIVGGMTYGTADRVIIKGTHAYLVDLKTGWGYIDSPEYNRQSHAYTAGVFELFPHVQTVEAIFDIPKRDEVIRHTWSRAKDFDYLSAVLRSIITKIENHTDEDLCPTEEGCFYCARRGGRCAAMNKKTMVLAKRYAPLEIVETDEFHSSNVTDPSQMARLMDVARVVEKFAESVKKHACDLARQGVPIPGYSLRERDGLRKITHPVGATIAAMATARELSLPVETTDLFGVADFKVRALEELLLSHCDSREDRERVLAKFNDKLIEQEAVEEWTPIAYLQKNRRNSR